jgi:ATP-dependent helicase YprA (DUF1998 family)
MTFSALGLAAPLLQALETLGYKTPTPVQAQAIPAVLAGRDLMAAAQTGTGKTAGFALPLLQRLAPARKNRWQQLHPRAGAGPDPRTGRAGECQLPPVRRASAGEAATPSTAASASTRR